MVDKRVWGGVIFFLVFILVSWIWIKPIVLFLIFLLGCHIIFFRDPQRRIPEGEAPVAPADGEVVEISSVREDRFLGEEAVKISIFLSILDPHVNRSPIQGNISYLHYQPGRFFNAMKPVSARENQSNWIGIQKEKRKVLMRQITGAIAKRIFCDVELRQFVQKGEKVGIICYGSRAEFYAPKRFFQPTVRLGEKVKAGETMLGIWL